MQISESGVLPTSSRYFFTPSSLARDLFYYPTRCGHYFCSHLYTFSHRSAIALQGDHNQNIMLLVVRSGALELSIAGQTMLATSGQVVLFDCREPYHYTAADGLEFVWLLFNGLNTRAFYQRILQARGGRAVFSPSAYTEILSLLDNLISSCAGGERMTETACSQMLHRLLCLLLINDTNPAAAADDRIAAAIRFMNTNLTRPVNVRTVAQAVSLSPSHFSREFKSQTGYSPYEYIVLRRIDRAKHLLTSTSLSVKEVAYAIGYNSEENFIHSFQKNVGISPGLFRRHPI